MKKPKVRLDKATIQAFFLENVEKIVFGLAALAFVYFIYSMFAAKPYDKTPDDLIKKVTAGKRILD